MRIGIDLGGTKIEAIALDPAAREFNRDVFYGDEAEAQTIVTAAQTVPWLVAQRLVVVRGAEALPRAADAILVAYCKQPAPSTCLVFTAQRAEAGRPLFALLLKTPWSVRFRRLMARELAAWIDQHVTFPSSMVDRITPVPAEDELAEVRVRTGLADLIPVLCEPFRQFVVEDDFAAPLDAEGDAGQAGIETGLEHLLQRRGRPRRRARSSRPIS